MEEKKITPLVFISYSWESEVHWNWVRKLAGDLVKNGVDVLLDQWDNKSGSDIAHFMDKSGRIADRVLCILTPTYREKANDLIGGVGYEYRNMTAELFANVNTIKFIPVLRKGTFEESVPVALLGRVAVDMREDSKYEENLEDLLRDILDKPKYKKPELGPPPKFSQL